MTGKRISRHPNPPASSVAIRTKILTEQAVAKVLEPSATERFGITRFDPELRRQMVAAAAYFIAERRGFTAGHELDDWIAAEAAVDFQLLQTRAA